MKIVWGRSINFNIELNKMVKLTQPIPGWKPMDSYIITDGADCYPWREAFAWFPVKTITGLRAWGVKIYKRKVWVVWGTGFHMEPETQYATLFEILKSADQTEER
jgi:hypothetical protein